MSLSSPMRVAPDAQRLDISHTLKPVVRAIGISRVARGALLGFTLGALAGACVLTAAHIWSVGPAVPISVLSLVAGTIAGIVWGIARWPRSPEAARTADLYFGLDDRLTTAVELASSDAAVANVQSRDTARRIEGLPLHRSRGRWLRRREAAAVAVAAIAFAATLALGPPTGNRHAAVTAQGTASSHRARRAAAHQIQKLQAQMHLGLTAGQRQTPAMRKLDLALTTLRRQLLKAGTNQASLRAISATQHQLHTLASSLHPVNSHAVAQLNGSLSHYLGKRAGNTRNGRTNRSAAATAQALNRLAQSLAHLSPRARAALARALAQSANSTANMGLRSLLRQAAFSLANNNPHAAQSALQRAARTLSQSVGAQAAQSRALSSAERLSAFKRALASSGALSSGRLSHLPGSSGPPSLARGPIGKSGQNRSKGLTPGRGKGQGQGKGIGLGRKAGGSSRSRAGAQAGQARGRGRGRGAASGHGRSTATGRGTSRSGAHGAGGRGTRAATRAGRTVTVYVAGKQGKGREIIRNGPNGTPRVGSLVPYQQVLGRYAQQAHQALDHGSLPPAVQSYVHRYFSTISH